MTPQSGEEARGHWAGRGHLPGTVRGGSAEILPCRGAPQKARLPEGGSGSNEKKTAEPPKCAPGSQGDPPFPSGSFLANAAKML